MKPKLICQQCKTELFVPLEVLKSMWAMYTNSKRVTFGGGRPRKIKPLVGYIPFSALASRGPSLASFVEGEGRPRKVPSDKVDPYTEEHGA